VSSRRSQAGASLVEVLVSLVFFAIAMLGVAAAFPVSRAAVAMGDRTATALGLARQTLEEMRNRRFTTTVDEITSANFPDRPYGSIPNFPTFRRTVTIANGVPEAVCTPAPGTPCSKRVTVRVFFRDHQGQEQHVPLNTIFVR
jgi:Tfp pilus assembly protein PilV